MGVLLCILGTVVRYKIISVDDQRFGQILFLGFLKKDVPFREGSTSRAARMARAPRGDASPAARLGNSILTNNRDSGEKKEAFR